MIKSLDLNFVLAKNISDLGIEKIYAFVDFTYASPVFRENNQRTSWNLVEWKIKYPEDTLKT